MSYEAEITSLQNRFNSQWGSTTAVQWPNVAFDTREVSEFVRFDVLNEIASQAGMGSENSNLYRHPGFVSMSIFVKPNTGPKRALQLADLVAAVWRGAQFDSITMFTPSIDVVGVSDGWFQINVLCRYYRDEYLLRSA